MWIDHYRQMLESGKIETIPWETKIPDDPYGNTLAHWAAERQLLPANFSNWMLHNLHEETVIEVAINAGWLPDGFGHWDLPLKHYGLKVAHLAAEKGLLPSSFDRWDIAAEDGKTVAHILAENDKLPDHVLSHPVMWQCDRDGMSVFHLLARNQKLPENFSRWEYAGNLGWAVAHEAATVTGLDKDFPLWHLHCEDGISVARVALMYHALPEGFSRWDIEDVDGLTIAHKIVSSSGAFSLPEGFDQWTLEDRMGRSVAHTALAHDALSPDFSQWDIVDRSGETVEDCLKRMMKEEAAPPLNSFSHYEAWKLRQNVANIAKVSPGLHKKAF